MPKKLKLPSIDIVLAIVLVAAAVTAVSTFRSNANMEQEKVRLEARARATEQNAIGAEKEANLESLSQALERVRADLGDNPFPSEQKARAFVDEVAQFAQTNGVIIITWNHSYTSVALKAGRYPAMTHSLTLEGNPNSLISFLDAATHAAARPLVQNMNMSVVTAKEDVWRMGLELVVYYHD